MNVDTEGLSLLIVEWRSFLQACEQRVLECWLYSKTMYYRFWPLRWASPDYFPVPRKVYAPSMKYLMGLDM